MLAHKIIYVTEFDVWGKLIRMIVTQHKLLQTILSYKPKNSSLHTVIRFYATEVCEPREENVVSAAKIY